MTEHKTPRYKLTTRWSELQSERATWMGHWKEISNYLLPRSGRFYAQDRNKGQKQYNNIYDSEGTRALRTLAAGMMSGMTSPARPWFRLGIADQALSDSSEVKIWLNDATKLMHTIFQKSNTYRALHTMYEELGSFGTAACLLLSDFDNVIHCYPLTVGEYALATDWKGRVTTIYREFQRTVGELVKEFGVDRVTIATRSMYNNGNLDAWVTVIHCIEPRSDRDPKLKDDKNMPYRSVYFEKGAQPDQYLRESGFKRFPAICPRWSVRGGDIYGNSPAMESMGDIKQLQHEQYRKAQVIDLQTNPPLQVPTSMKNRVVDALPGGVNYVDVASPGAGIRTAYDVNNIKVNDLLGDIQDVRQRIRSSFYADMFLMLASQQDSRMTATEVAERREEKLLMLGPVLERLQNEMLDPLIDITFDHIMEAGLLPPLPQALQVSDVSVELISMLAQAQRAIATNGIDRFVGNLGAIAQYKPDALDKFDADRWADIYSDSLGLDPSLIVPEERVQAIRQARAQEQQRQQQMEEAQQQVDAANKLAGTKTNEQNALTDVTRAFSGYT